MAAFSLIPREEKFYVDFIQMAELGREAGHALEAMLAGDEPDLSRSAVIEEIEHKCDYVAHAILQRLNRTFVTPLDREDIHALTGALDDVVDAIEDVAVFFPLYRIDRTRAGVGELAAIIRRQTEEILHAVQALEKRDGVLDRLIEINRLEHEADVLHAKLIGELFDNEKDPVALIKWRQILFDMERASDQCEDVANQLESIVVKHG